MRLRPSPGAKALGPFYEMESSSPAAALAPGASMAHTHRTIHLSGSKDGLDAIALPTTRLTQAQLYAIVDTILLRDSVYKSAGSVHGCALFSGSELRLFVEDVGRHNAIDTIAGWLALQGAPVPNAVFYTTGRLTSEMVIKAAQMGVAVVISRSGMTQMGHAVAARLGLCAIGRATNRRFLCFTASERLVFQPELACVIV